MLKIIYQELVAIRKELQAIRSSLEPDSRIERTIDVKPSNGGVGIPFNKHQQSS